MKSFIKTAFQVLLVGVMLASITCWIVYEAFGTDAEPAPAVDVLEVDPEYKVAVTADGLTEVVSESVDTYHDITVVATAYCSCEKCCGKWALNRPNGKVITANGSLARSHHTIAVDPDFIPYGTIVLIDGAEYVAEDSGAAIKGNMIDIYFDSHEEAQNFGRQTITVKVKG